MANELWGPLAGLIGTWESGWDGLDVAFHNDKGKIHETPFREKTTFKPFHTEVGYWMWDAKNKQVTRCFVIPRAQALIAGATVEPDATSFRLEARIGSNTYGILSNQHIDEVAHSTRFDVTVSYTDDTFTYDETTEIEHKKYPSVVMHTDRNTLKLISRDE